MRRAVDGDARGHADETQGSLGPSLKEAIRLAQHAASQGEEYDPGEDFDPASAYGEFVFSEPDLLRVLDRRNRVSAAWDHANRRPTRPKTA